MAIIATEIVEIINNDDTTGHNVWGIRAIHHQDAVKVGDVLGPSYRWDDGDCTDEVLEGVCAVQCTAFDCTAEVPMVERALRMINGYPCDQLVLIAAGRCVGGEDRGEIIMRDAVVVAILESAK